MHDLAITKGLDFIAYTRNANAIGLPDGTIALGPLVTLPHLSGLYTIRRVELTGPEPGPLEIGGTAPPVIEGDVVVIRRTVQPLSEEMTAARSAQARQDRRDDLAAALVAIDTASARPLRAIVGGTATKADRDRLAELETHAATLRAELSALSTPTPSAPSE